MVSKRIDPLDTETHRLMNDPPSHAAWQRLLESLPSQSPLVLLLLGVVFLFLVGRCLQIACNLLGEDHPGLVRCTVLSLAIAGVSNLLWDGLSFWLMMNTRDLTGIQMDAGLRLPAVADRAALSEMASAGPGAVLRDLPVLFAFCLATALYVLTLKVTFRFSLAIFAVQWVLTLMGTGLAAFILTHALGSCRGRPREPVPVGPGQNPQAQVPQRITPEVRGKTRPGRPRTGPPPVPQAPPAGTQPPDTLRTTLQDHSEPASPTLKWLRDKVELAPTGSTAISWTGNRMRTARVSARWSGPTSLTCRRWCKSPWTTAAGAGAGGAERGGRDLGLAADPQSAACPVPVQTPPRQEAAADPCPAEERLHRRCRHGPRRNAGGGATGRSGCAWW